MTQFYVIAQNDEENGWLQILLYIVIAAFWIIGGILKKVKDNKWLESLFKYGSHQDDKCVYALNKNFFI